MSFVSLMFSINIVYRVIVKINIVEIKFDKIFENILDIVLVLLVICDIIDFVGVLLK